MSFGNTLFLDTLEYDGKFFDDPFDKQTFSGKYWSDTLSLKNIDHVRADEYLKKILLVFILLMLLVLLIFLLLSILSVLMILRLVLMGSLILFMPLLGPLSLEFFLIPLIEPRKVGVLFWV